MILAESSPRYGFIALELLTTFKRFSTPSNLPGKLLLRPWWLPERATLCTPLRRYKGASRLLRREGCALPFPPLPSVQSLCLSGIPPRVKDNSLNMAHNKVMAQAQTTRPRLTISQAVEQFAVSRSTLKRGLETGRYPNAAKESGAWSIPVESLHAEHKPRRSQTEAKVMDQTKTQVQTDMNQDHELAQRVRELEQALAIEQAERRAAERVAEAESKRAETAERALLMLEAGSSPQSASNSLPSTPTPKRSKGFFALLKRGQ